jgi:aminoglycoside 3-N-acetyltransferase
LTSTDGIRPDGPPAVGRARLVADLRAIGVREAAVLLVHTRMSAIGWVVGAAETVVRALLEALGPDGTLMAYTSWDDHVYHGREWPAAHRDAYRAQPPAFDPTTAEAARDHGRIPERVRTWPGARRSAHPEASVAAVGARAAWLTDDHPQRDAYGAASPFARLVESRGQVLLLGAPLETATLLHHAEAIARAPGRRRVTFRVPVVEDGRVTERTFTDLDTTNGAFPYAELGLDEDEFAVIARAALAAGAGVRGLVGHADSHLFDARALTAFAVAWLEDRFGAGARR